MPLVASYHLDDGTVLQLPSALHFTPRSACVTGEFHTPSDEEVILHGTHVQRCDAHFSYYSFGGLLGKVRSHEPRTHLLLAGTFSSSCR